MAKISNGRKLQTQDNFFEILGNKKGIIMMIKVMTIMMDVKVIMANGMILGMKCLSMIVNIMSVL